MKGSLLCVRACVSCVYPARSNSSISAARAVEFPLFFAVLFCGFCIRQFSSLLLFDGSRLRFSVVVVVVVVVERGGGPTRRNFKLPTRRRTSESDAVVVVVVEFGGCEIGGAGLFDRTRNADGS